MAFVKDDDEENLNQQSGQPQGSEQVLSTGTSGAGAPGQSAAEGPAAGEKAKGTGWTNLVSYVDANKPQANAMAQKVVGGVSARAAGATSTGDLFAAGAKETVGNQTPKRDNSIISDLGTNAASIANDETRRKTYESMRDASYTGPNAASEASGFNAASKGYQDVAKSADVLEDFEGRRDTIAKAYEPRDDYNAGEQRLDSFLVGQGPARETILQGKKDFGTGSTFTQGWDDILTGVDTDIGGAKAATDQLRTDTGNAATTSLDASKKVFDDYSTTAVGANKANDDIFARLSTEVSSPNSNIRGRAFAEIGLDTATGEFLLKNGAKMSDLISAGKRRNAGDFAQDAEIAQFNALSSLMPGSGLDANMVSKTGASANPFESNQEKITLSREAKTLQDGLESRLKTEQQKRDDSYNVYANAIQSYQSGPSSYSRDPTAHMQPLAKLTGISAQSLSEAQEKGLDVSQYLTKGAALNVGDVTLDSERQGWSSLLGKIGINPQYDVSDSQDEGKAYGFDLAGLAAAVKNVNAPKVIKTASKNNQQQDPKKAVTAEAKKAIAPGVAVTAAPLSKKAALAPIKALPSSKKIKSLLG